MVGVGVPIQLARVHSIKNLECGEPLPFLCLLWCLVLSRLNHLSCITTSCRSRSRQRAGPVGSATVACTVESHALVVSSSQGRSRSCRCIAPVRPPRFSELFLNRFCHCGAPVGAPRSVAILNQTSWTALAVPRSAFWICPMIGTSESRAPVRAAVFHAALRLWNLLDLCLGNLLHPTDNHWSPFASRQ